jgi:hypothetical protein
MSEGQSGRMVFIPDDILMVLQRGSTAWREKRFDDARLLMEQALSMAQKANNLHAILSAKHMLANIAFNQCEDAKSRALHEECLAACRAMDFRGAIASSLGNLALIDIVEGKFDDARAKYEEATKLYEAAGLTAEAAGCRRALEDLIVQRKPLTVPRQPRHV